MHSISYQITENPAMGTIDHHQQAETTPGSVILQQYWIRLCCKAFITTTVDEVHTQASVHN